jgi:hypothetical protein
MQFPQNIYNQKISFVARLLWIVFILVASSRKDPSACSIPETTERISIQFVLKYSTPRYWTNVLSVLVWHAYYHILYYTR